MRFLRVLPLLLLLTGFALRSGPATLYLTGDSTLAQKLAERRPETGWGEALQQYFDIDRVRVENHARNGRSTRTFLEEGRWQAVVDRLKPGDYVFVQFGHNDASRDRVDRYTPPEDYRRNLVRFVREARAKGAHPVLLTPVMRRRFDASGTFQDSHGEYPDLVRAVAAEHRVPLLDMHRRSEAILRRFGVEGSRSLFLHLKPGEYPNYPQGLDDNTHFSPFGAEVMAAAVVEGIRELGIGLAERLSPGGRAVTTARFAPPAEPGLLAPARISALPPEEREAWERYLAASRRQAEVDRRVMAEELRAAGLERPTPAPHADGFGVEPRMTAGWFRGEEARRIADAIVSFQTPAGGWSKRMEFTRARRPGESWASEGNWSWIGTFDNGATTSQLRFLAGVTRARGDERYRASFLRGLGYTLAAQFPNGCWPQVYPLVGSYHDAATYNDDAMVNVLAVLREAAGGGHALVPEEARTRARATLERGVECVVRSQVVVDGRRTAWGQQHDPLTLMPVRARSYEHASLTGRESTAVLELLMRLESPDPRVAAAVRGAVQWFRDTAVWGYEYTFRGGLTPRPGAGPLWARFYEIGTNRPMFSNRDGVIRYRFEELDPERSRGYAWYTPEPAAALRTYEGWARRHARAPVRATRAPVAAAVDAGYTGPEGARVEGVPTYRTLGAALAAAPSDATASHVIRIRNGRYREKLSVDKPHIHLVGESREGTVLTFDVAAGMRSPGGWTYGTRGSFTLRVAAPDFRLESMTVENAFDYPGNAAKAETDSTRINGAQAVAVMLDEGSDRAVFRDCVVSGHQDTLFPNAGRSYFHRCTVLGSVDFIFGAGIAVFDDSDIVSRDRGSRTNNGYITAPSTPISQPYGFVFVDSRLRKESPSLAPGSVTLGRPWHPSGNPHAIGSAVYLHTWMDDHIAPRGWDPMNSTDAAGRRVENRPEDARFFEHGSTGPGAVSHPLRRLLSEAEARRYALDRVLGGWHPRR